MLKDPYFYILAANSCFLVYSHRTLGRAIKATQECLIDLITGRVREIGTKEAQTQAILSNAQLRAAERIAARRAAAPLNL